MADSNITRRALAAALKAQMQEEPFSGVCIAEICDRCDMNRKSFYYHFKDKYDLLNWIYDTEFLAVTKDSAHMEGWGFMEKLLQYLYENRAFYRRAMEVKGQNSFHEHFRALLLPEIGARLITLLPADTVTDFQVGFFTDATLGAMEVWLREKEPESPQALLGKLQSCFPQESHER